MSYPRRIASGIATLNVYSTVVLRYDPSVAFVLCHMPSVLHWGLSHLASVAIPCALRPWYRIWREGR